MLTQRMTEKYFEVIISSTYATKGQIVQMLNNEVKDGMGVLSYAKWVV